MPSIVGAVKVNSISQGSNFQIGDTAFIVLNSATKNYAGAASFSPGDAFDESQSNNPLSQTNVNDPDVNDTIA
ncbi:spore germination protein [Cohnella zeiphila]|uniref:Spore germination protein n=1 Tax=Cohnella zeiphila TaxID=2761120 RepID=A0A7X0VWH1_9BACL|nr:spore germination protein [Cohnella zeiphila]MBB6732951.1 spore germination protein [Cohnella zeiphila]